MVNRCKGLWGCTPRPRPLNGHYSRVAGVSAIIYSAAHPPEQAAALGDSWQWGTIQEPLGPIVWPAPVPASAPTHTHLCEASQSLYSSSNQHRLPSPPETHTTAKVNNYSRVILPVLDHPTLSPPDAATHTTPNTSQHFSLEWTQPAAFIQNKLIKTLSGGWTDMTLEFTNCCFPLSCCSWCVWLSSSCKCWMELC